MLVFFFSIYFQIIFSFLSLLIFISFSSALLFSSFPFPPPPSSWFAFFVCLAASFFRPQKAITLHWYHWQCGNLPDFVWNSGYGVSAGGSLCKGNGCFFRRCAWWEGIIWSGSGFFLVHVHFFFYSVLSLLFSLLVVSSPFPPFLSHEIPQSCVPLLSFPPSMIDGVLDFPLI